MTASLLAMHRGAAAVAAVGLVLAGAGATYLLMRSDNVAGDGMAAPGGRDGATRPAASRPRSAGVPVAAAAPLPDAIVQLTDDAVERAGITIARVEQSSTAATLRLPATIEPNGYRQVAVTPLVAGRITAVSAELGTPVRRGQRIARIYSPQLAAAQSRYVSARAMLDAHDRELQRTQKLVDIGAASRQELERAHAEHAAQTAAVQSARSELDLLGAAPATPGRLDPAQAISATIDVRAPIDGIVIARAANVGVNVDPGTTLFTVVDLSTVWAVANLYEKDFSRVRVGSDASVMIPAYPTVTLRGRVSYIDPQVSRETRTAMLRVEVPNRGRQLRLGMYAEVTIAGAAASQAAVIPHSAVQNVADRTVVYLADSKRPGTFIEREVRLGQASAGHVQVSSGVLPGDLVVTDGSFYLRAERERQGSRSPAGDIRPDPAGASSQSSDSDGMSKQTARVAVTERGFEPSTVVVRKGETARITFLRTTDKTCATEIVLPSLNTRRALPLNEPVIVEFTPAGTGITFACGMGMLRGTVRME